MKFAFLRKRAILFNQHGLFWLCISLSSLSTFLPFSLALSPSYSSLTSIQVLLASLFFFFFKNTSLLQDRCCTFKSLGNHCRSEKHLCGRITPSRPSLFDSHKYYCRTKEEPICLVSFGAGLFPFCRNSLSVFVILETQ